MISGFNLLLTAGVNNEAKNIVMLFSIAKYLNKDKTGSILSLVVLISIIVSIISVSLLSLGFHARTRALRTSEEMSASVAADAGLAHAVSLLNKKLSDRVEWDDTPLPHESAVHLPNSNANYSFVITGDTENGYPVKSTGTTGISQKTTRRTRVTR